MNAVHRIDKFEGQGFHTWQMKIKFHLMRENLWSLVKDYISSTTSSASYEDTSSSLQIDEARNERAYAIIALGLSDDYMHHISALDSAAEAWKTLDALFGASGKTSKLNLKIAFFELQMKDDDTIASHVNKMRSLMTQLAAVESPVTDDDAMAVLLKSVPETYDHLTSTLKNLPDPTFDGIVSALQEEERVKNKRINGAHKEQAYFTKTSWKGPFPTCRHCGKKNHDEKDCFKKNPCKICGKTNHATKDCHLKKDVSANTVVEEEKGETANVVECYEEQNIVTSDSFDKQYAF